MLRFDGAIHIGLSLFDGATHPGLSLFDGATQLGLVFERLVRHTPAFGHPSPRGDGLPHHFDCQCLVIVALPRHPLSERGGRRPGCVALSNSDILDCVAPGVQILKPRGCVASAVQKRRPGCVAPSRANCQAECLLNTDYPDLHGFFIPYIRAIRVHYVETKFTQLQNTLMFFCIFVTCFERALNQLSYCKQPN